MSQSKVFFMFTQLPNISYYVDSLSRWSKLCWNNKMASLWGLFRNYWDSPGIQAVRWWQPHNHAAAHWGHCTAAVFLVTSWWMQHTVLWHCTSWLVDPTLQVVIVRESMDIAGFSNKGMWAYCSKWHFTAFTWGSHSTIRMPSMSQQTVAVYLPAEGAVQNLLNRGSVHWIWHCAATDP
jgi:hypothetical protein